MSASRVSVYEALEKEALCLSWIWVKLENLPFHFCPDHAIVMALYIIPLVFFCVYGILLWMVDQFSSGDFRRKHKVQHDIRITNQQYFDAVKVAVFNWIFLALPYACFLAYIVMPWLMPSMPPIPTVGVFIRDMTVFVAVEEVMFYFSHKLLHTSRFYARIHKFHHVFTAPFGIAAIYAHPIEHMLSNVIPISIGPLIMKSHPILPCLWSVLALFNTMTVHSGYDFSSLCILFPAPYFHDWHHEKFTENFGATQVLDYVFQTNTGYLQAITRGEVYAPRRANNSKQQ